ncbi:beta strand repeat-containing protein [Methylomicrobium lacus]|uniref:beta strand repeat-containing protein n=1 Tax=Methylomicrobium lacus TaxID=136992 RepID=UPI0035A9A21D
MTVLSASAQAATPPAGATISNRATADYNDTGGTLQHASSNEVTTTVTQVGSYTLDTDNTKTAAPGTAVYMPHTLTNTGNGADTFNITLPTTFDTTYLSGVAIYPDANADGQPDGTTPLCTVGGSPACTGTNVQTGLLAAGDAFHFVVVMNVKATALNGTMAAPEVVTAVPVSAALYATATLSNNDTLTVANNIPVFAVNKSIISSLTTGPAGTEVEYKLAYTNSGNAAGPLYLKDLIGSVTTASYSYVTGSAKWSSSGATALTDAADTGADPSGVVYQAITSSGTTTIEAFIANVPANASGFITFKVTVEAGAPLGTSETTNIAEYARANNGTADCTGLPCTPASGTVTTTNQSPFTVIGSYNVVANNSTTSSTDGDNTAAAGNDVVTVASAAPGAVVSFNNIIWNTGTSSDTFNITTGSVTATASTAFPVGTTFQLFKSDGSTPLTSSDADGIPDTGPVAAGAYYTVVLKATLPANACNPTCPTGPFTVSKTATSQGNPSKSNTVFDQLTAIAQPSVDLTNADAKGAGAGSVASPAITTVSVAPGATAYFNLNVTNSGAAIDNYNLSYHLLDTTGSDLASAAAFSPGTLLAGWTVTFHVNTAGTGACSAGTLGSVVTNTGAVAPSTTANFCAVVTTPAAGPTALAGSYRTYFRVMSGATGASDIKLDAVTLTPLINLTLTPSGTGQIQPGGTIQYPHTLANGGNQSCGGNFSFTVTNSQAAAGWSYLLYLDNNGDGQVDASDTVLGGGSNATDTITTTMSALSAGTSVKLLVKVQAPAGATSGALDVINITATDTVLSCGTTAPIADTTTVLAGQIRLVKTQALGTWTGTGCGTAPNAASYASTALSQKPGECIWYKVVATNEGDADVTNVVINDATPTFTTYGGGGACSAGATLAVPAVGSTGAVNCDKWSTVAPAATVQLDFAVRIDQ